MHNAQPWKFRYGCRSRTLTLRADFERAMPKADPPSRALHIGCGAALLNLRVSAAHHGLDAVTALLPVPSEPAVLATVRPGIRPEAAREPADGLSRFSTRRSRTGTPAVIRSTNGRSPATSGHDSPTRPGPKARTSRS
ncbi:hypothetical protein ACFYZN_35550 [Streptomyces sp. NPDC001777]|uniref:hypothetical protein n=1 Tax=Streptomyces sp. NPDC001777 TaxID=3364608 RepID=UPI0036B9AB40